VQQLGGRETPAAGFAMGVERLLSLLEDAGVEVDNTPDVFVVLQGDLAQQQGMALVETIRELLPNVNIQTNCGAGSFKSQIKKADKSGARVALILGDEELQNNQISIKMLREKTDQKTVDQSKIVTELNTIL
jgi:histidyl-tRNA synthetase